MVNAKCRRWTARAESISSDSFRAKPVSVRQIPQTTALAWRKLLRNISPDPFHTILRSRFYSQTRDVIEILHAVLAAALTVATERRRFLLPIATLAAIAAGIVIIGYITYTRFLIYFTFTAEPSSFPSPPLLHISTAIPRCR